MARRPQPGQAFWIVCDLGFAVGLMTHYVPRVRGELIWIAEPTFDEEPTVEDVERIDRWRWPVFFPLSVALHRKLVTRIGMVPIPRQLQPFPLLRNGDKKHGWRLVRLVQDANGSLAISGRGLGQCKDPSVPIDGIVNDTRLKERIVSGWRPEDVW